MGTMHFEKSRMGVRRIDLMAVGRCLIQELRWAWQACVELNKSAHFPSPFARSHPSVRMGNCLFAFAGANCQL